MRGDEGKDSRGRARLQAAAKTRVRPETVHATERKERQENGGRGIERRRWRLCHKPPFSVHCFWPDKKSGPIVS